MELTSRNFVIFFYDFLYHHFSLFFLITVLKKNNDRILYRVITLYGLLIFCYTTLTNLSTRYLVICKVYTDVDVYKRYKIGGYKIVNIPCLSTGT